VERRVVAKLLLRKPVKPLARSITHQAPEVHDAILLRFVGRLGLVVRFWVERG
jgi:hypothetical protein